MTSIRKAIGRLGFPDNIMVSVLRDFFGFRLRQVPPNPFPDSPRLTVSVKQQLESLRSSHFHLNVILVGWEGFVDDDLAEVDYSIYRIRNIYAQVGLGVGRAQHWVISTPDAQGLQFLIILAQVERLSNLWRVPNDGVDVFIVSMMEVLGDDGPILGQSPTPGPCEGQVQKGMNGAVVGLWGSAETSWVLAHEVGHYLGIGHENDPNNLVFPKLQPIIGEDDHVLLTAQQRVTLRKHCLVKPGFDLE